MGEQNLLIRDVGQNRRMEGKSMSLIDAAEYSGSAGIEIDGGEVTTDLLAVGEMCFPADSPTTVMASSSCS